MEVRKNRSVIDVAAIMVDKIHKIWEEKNIAASLLMNVKGAFDYVSQVKCAQRIKQLGVDNDLIGLTQCFFNG